MIVKNGRAGTVAVNNNCRCWKTKVKQKMQEILWLHQWDVKGFTFQYADLCLNWDVEESSIIYRKSDVLCRVQMGCPQEQVVNNVIWSASEWEQSESENIDKRTQTENAGDVKHRA